MTFARLLKTAHAAGALSEVIIETSLLTDEEKVIACLLAKGADADYVKTSTGFSSGGATVHDVALMRKSVESDLGVKLPVAFILMKKLERRAAAGATRIAQAARQILQEKYSKPQSAQSY